MDSILDIIEAALAKAGFKILDGDSDTVFIRGQKNDRDYEIRVTEVAKGSKMEISIVRTGKKIQLSNKENPLCRDAMQIANANGYRRILVSKIENVDEIYWQGIEFNRLLIKDGVVFRFNRWVAVGKIEIEEIGGVKA